jgi:hypothetical protein
MKSKLLFALLFLYTSTIFAKEGMWLPFLLEKMNEKEMQSMGCKLKAKDIYDINNGSLKDAVVIFGSGCTGEVISNKGLVLTNHHCGYGTVQGLSSVTNDYLTNGFFAKSIQEEIPCAGLSVTFIKRIDDVTAQVYNGVKNTMPDTTQARLKNLNIDKIQLEAKKKTGYDAQVKSFYYDNTYYLFLSEKFTDVRLVCFPPNGIGKFGGDTDNWAWPRHTGDFGLFRIYANKENKASAYNKDNIPFVPIKSFPINISGVKENDFTWVYGFPGRTTQYLTSGGVEELMTISDPIRIKNRAARLNIMDEQMRNSKDVFIKYAAKQAGIANYYKKWQGELLGLKQNKAIEKKQQQEKLFNEWVAKDINRIEKYANIVDTINYYYKKQKDLVKTNEYINEGIRSCELIAFTNVYDSILKHIDTASKETLLKFVKQNEAAQKNYDEVTDRRIAEKLFDIYVKDETAFGKNNAEIMNEFYTKTYLLNNKLEKLLADTNKDVIKKAINDDAVYIFRNELEKKQGDILKSLKPNQLRITALYKKYINGLMEFNAGKQFYPDANSTLRVTYGKVQGITPKDGMTYNYYTTLDGAIAKEDTSIEEFKVPAKLKELHASKDYGMYSIKKANGETTVPLAFLASNHTTGGNSGSPVLNAKGELIGTNFDRIWEGTMSDLMYDINLCRNISLDIRYTLFIIDKFGGAGWLLNEMNIVKNTVANSKIKK